MSEITTLPRLRINPVPMPSNSPTISAVVIVKNEEATIRRCIQSVLTQSVPVHEIIVVDGNSTDQTYRYVSELAARYEEITLVSEDSTADECGPAAARNTGAALANGDLLLFLNGDVTIEQDYVARLLRLMDKRHLDAAAGLRWNVRNSLVSGLMNVHNALKYDSSPVEEQTSPAFLSGDAMIIKAEHFWAIGGYDASMPAGEDADFGYRLVGYGSNIGYDKAAMIWHEGRHYRSLADWLQQLKWYGRGAASLARAHSWRLERERTGLHRNIVLPVSAILIFLLIAITFGAVVGPLAWVLGAIGFTAAGFKYVLSAMQVQRRCSSVEPPTQLLPLDIVLYPLFKSVRSAALSAFTWHSLLSSGEIEPERRTEDGAL